MERMNPDYIEETVRTYADMLLRIAFQQLASWADAQDVVQEVFLRLMNQPGFTSGEHLRAWLIRVTVNCCRDVQKSHWRKKREPLSEDWPDGLAESDRFVLLEIWRLPVQSRNILHLHYVEGYTISEIAKILDRKENTVASQLRRARLKLKDLLQEEEK